MEKHRAPALGHEGDPGAPRRGRVAEADRLAVDDQRAMVGADSPKSVRASSSWPPPMKPVDAEHLAAAHGQRHVSEIAPAGRAARFQATGASGRRSSVISPV